MRYNPNKDPDDYFFFIIKKPHETPDGLLEENVAKMKDWRSIRDNADIYNQKIGHICFPVYNQMTFLGALARAWRSPFNRCTCPHCSGTAYFIPDKYQDLVHPRDYSVPPIQEKWEDFYNVREQIHFICCECGNSFHKNVSADQYIDAHLHFAELLSSANHDKKDSIIINRSKKFYDADITYDELWYLLWEDEPYQIEGNSREILCGIIQSYQKLGYFDSRFFSGKDVMSIDKLKDIIRNCEKSIR